MIKRIAVLVISVCLCASLGRAGMTASGDVDPADPADWGDFTFPAIGTFGAGSVIIDDDSDAISYFGTLGFLPGSAGAVTIRDAGSTWTNSDGLCVGWYGDGTLNVADGGTLINDGEAQVGYESGSTGAVRVSGSGSTWTNSADVYISSSGDGTLDITDSGAVSTVEDGYIGHNSGSTGVMTVRGVGSTWTSSGGLSVGFSGDGTLEITDGAAVGNMEGYIGYESGSRGVVTVSGAGSTWTCIREFMVGRQGDGTLDIIDGGSVVSGSEPLDGYIGYGPDSTGVVTVSGVGSSWTSSAKLTVASHLGGAGRLEITDGGAVNGGVMVVTGVDATGVVTVRDAGSILTMWRLDVGMSGPGVLNVSDGALVKVSDSTSVSRSAGTGIIDLDNGTLTTGSLHAVWGDLRGRGTINTNGLVSDMDLLFDDEHSLTRTFALDGPGHDITVNLDVNGLGAMGAGCRSQGSMLISNGLTVRSSYGYVGFNSGSSGIVTVNGIGSTWANSKRLYIGFSGDGRLEINNGAAISSDDGYIGANSGSRGVVTVSGPGSTWASSDTLYVGNHGYGVLEITNGGSVSNEDCRIGHGSASRGVVKVKGVGSTLTISDDLRVGYRDNGTLSIAYGGLVSVGNYLTFDYSRTAGSYVTMTTGGMLALKGNAAGSLGEFMGLIYGTDDIRYWDESVGGWANIAGAIAGYDYRLTYLTEGDLAGYTMLTVIAVPEPATLGMVALGSLVGLRRRRRRRRQNEDGTPLVPR